MGRSGGWPAEGDPRRRPSDLYWLVCKLMEELGPVDFPTPAAPPGLCCCTFISGGDRTILGKVEVCGSGSVEGLLCLDGA